MVQKVDIGLFGGYCPVPNEVLLDVESEPFEKARKLRGGFDDFWSLFDSSEDPVSIEDKEVVPGGLVDVIFVELPFEFS